MSADNEIRRQLGMDLIAAEREEAIRHPAKPIVKVEKPVDPRKTADEQCGVDGELLKGVVLGVAIGATSPELLPPGTLCFSSLDDYLAWCDKEDGSLDCPPVKAGEWLDY